MNIDKAVLSFAGVVVLASVALTLLYSDYWLILTGFVGLNMVQAGLTGFCPVAIVFRKLGLKSGYAFS